MSEVVHCVWANKEQAAKNLNGVLLPFARAQIAAGHKVEIVAKLHEDALTDRQRGYYHGIILTDIAQQVSVSGVKHPMPVWKEYFRSTYLGYKTVTVINPFTGKRSRRRVRISTEDLGVRAYAKLIDQVTAYAVQELGVRFRMDFPAWEKEYFEAQSRGELIV